MKKKLLSLAVALAMALTLLPTAAFAAEGDGVLGEGHPKSTATVDAAKISDRSGRYDDTSVQGTAYIVTPKDGDADCDKTIEIKVTELKKHKNGQGILGYWVGANIPASTDCTEDKAVMKYKWGSSFPPAMGSTSYDYTADTKDDLTNFYINLKVAEEDGKLKPSIPDDRLYLRVTWYKDGENTETPTTDTVYKFTIAEDSTAAVYVEPIPLNLTVNSVTIAADAKTAATNIKWTVSSSESLSAYAGSNIDNLIESLSITLSGTHPTTGETITETPADVTLGSYVEEESTNYKLVFEGGSATTQQSQYGAPTATLSATLKGPSAAPGDGSSAREKFEVVAQPGKVTYTPKDGARAPLVTSYDVTTGELKWKVEGINSAVTELSDPLYDVYQANDSFYYFFTDTDGGNEKRPHTQIVDFTLKDGVFTAAGVKADRPNGLIWVQNAEDGPGGNLKNSYAFPVKAAAQSTGSSGLPSSSGVKDKETAQAAAQQAQNMTQSQTDSLAEKLETALSDGVSASSGPAAGSGTSSSSSSGTSASPSPSAPSPSAGTSSGTSATSPSPSAGASSGVSAGPSPSPAAGSSAEDKPTSAEMEEAKAILKELTTLDTTLQVNGIKVNTVLGSNLPEGTKKDDFSIIGAAVNSKSDYVDYKVSGSTDSHSIPRAYNTDNTVAYNFELENVNNSHALKVPVVITMKVPSGLNAKKVVVLHYANGNNKAPDVTRPSVDGNKISFVVRGFSDFVLAEYSASGSGGGSGSHSGAAGNGSVAVGGGNITVTPTTPSGIFADVPYGHTFATEITWAKDNSILGGYSDGTFRPGAYTTRQALWMVLGRLAGANPADMTAAREWAISSGISDGTKPTDTLSRQQLITMLYRVETASGTPSGSADLSAFADSGLVADYAKEAMAWGVANGIIAGSNGNLNPESPATRAHFAAFLYRYANLPATPAPAAEDTVPAEDMAPAVDET